MKTFASTLSLSALRFSSVSAGGRQRVAVRWSSPPRRQRA